MSIGWACSDAHRNTYNNLLRFKTPNDDFDADDKCCTLISSCLCTPLTAIEGLGLIMCGLATCPVQLIGCRGKLTTHHYGKNVSCGGVSPDCGCPLLPFQYEDYVDGGGSSYSKNTGCTIKLAPCRQDYAGSIPHARVVSTLTPTDCIWGGTMNICNAFFQVACCPCMPIAWCLCY